MPNRSKRALMGEVADLLERWGRKHSLLADPYVEGLLNGLRTNSQLAYWVEQRAVEMLPMPNTTSVASDRRRVNLLNIRLHHLYCDYSSEKESTIQRSNHQKTPCNHC